MAIYEMRERVECRRCKAHRDLALFRKGSEKQLEPLNRCFVCGSEAYDHVTPSPGDRAAAEELASAEVVAAAEALDRALYHGGEIVNGDRHATRLSEACRKLALARAGGINHL